MDLLVEKILESGKKFVITVAGGGSAVFDMLLRNGGGSKILIEGNIPYSESSLKSFCYGSVLDKAVSVQTAIAIAQHSYERAYINSCIYNDNWDFVPSIDTDRLIGIGLTSKLTYDGERQDREHVACLAWKMGNDGGFVEVKINPSLSRAEQELLCAKLILNIIADICQIPNEYKYYVYNEIVGVHS